jgi:hypothetical protein
VSQVWSISDDEKGRESFCATFSLLIVFLVLVSRLERCDCGY